MAMVGLSLKAISSSQPMEKQETKFSKQTMVKTEMMGSDSIKHYISKQIRKYKLMQLINSPIDCNTVKNYKAPVCKFTPVVK
jgi:hypothetical protein